MKKMKEIPLVIASPIDWNQNLAEDDEEMTKAPSVVINNRPKEEQFASQIQEALGQPSHPLNLELELKKAPASFDYVH
jgi:hypothetical protein